MSCSNKKVETHAVNEKPRKKMKGGINTVVLRRQIRFYVINYEYLTLTHHQGGVIRAGCVYITIV